MTTLGKVQAIVSECLGKEIDKVTPDANVMEALDADSLDVVEIILECEKAFDIDVDDAEAEKVTTVQEIADLVDRVLSASHAKSIIGEDLDD